MAQPATLPMGGTGTPRLQRQENKKMFRNAHSASYSQSNKNKLHSYTTIPLPRKPPRKETKKEHRESEKPTTAYEDQISKFMEAIEKERKLQRCHQNLDLQVANNIYQALERASMRDLSEIKLRNCKISNEFLQKMLPKNLKVSVESLDLSANEGLNINTVKQLVTCLHTSILDLSDINMTAEQIQGLGKLKTIKSVKLRACTFQGDSIAKTLEALIKSGLETIELNDSAISGKDLQDIGCSMFDANELKKIDLSHIRFDETVAKAVSKICSKAKKLEWLNMHRCQLDGELVKVLTETEDVNPINTVILSSNPRTSEAVDVLASAIKKFRCRELDISSNSLSSTHIKELSEKDLQVDIIHVCENPIGSWKSFGDLIKNWRIREVDASGCQMFLEDFQDFASSLKDCLLDELNLSHPDRNKIFADKMREEMEAVTKRPKI